MNDQEYAKFTQYATKHITKGMSLETYAAKYGLSAAQLADLKRRRAAYDQKAASVEGGGK